MHGDISKKAVELVNGERQSTYGHPYQNFTDIGRIWGSILNIPDIDPEQVALMMMGVKLARLKNKYHLDGIVDFVGYENCLDQIIAKKNEIGRGIIENSRNIIAENYAKQRAEFDHLLQKTVSELEDTKAE